MKVAVGSRYEPLLAAFKAKARLHEVPYQTQIKNLMQAWLEKP